MSEKNVKPLKHCFVADMPTTQSDVYFQKLISPHSETLWWFDGHDAVSRQFRTLETQSYCQLTHCNNLITCFKPLRIRLVLLGFHAFVLIRFADMPRRVLDRSEVAQDNVIVFTKPILGTNHREQLTLGSMTRTSGHAAGEVRQREDENRICLRLGDAAVDNIERNVKNYEEFLRRRSHNIEGRFNPWIAVEQYVFILYVISINNTVLFKCSCIVNYCY